MGDDIDTFSAMLRRALGGRVADGADGFLAMLAEDGVMEFPYAPQGSPTRLEGRVAVARHLKELAGLIAFERIGKVEVYATDDPDTVVLEFEGFGRGIETGKPYEQRYISVIRTQAGQIVLYRDYWNPLALLRATRADPFVDAPPARLPDHG